MGKIITHINHWDETVSPWILEQYKDSKKYLACLKSVVDKLSEMDSAAVEVSTLLDFTGFITGAPAEGWKLDLVGNLLNIVREPGEDDDSYYNRIHKLNELSTAGTADNIISYVERLSGDKAPFYIDEAPATFFVYTLAGRQLKPHEVKRPIAPVGVLGLVGAAIDAGGFLSDANGDLILMTASTDSLYEFIFTDGITPLVPGWYFTLNNVQLQRDETILHLDDAVSVDDECPWQLYSGDTGELIVEGIASNANQPGYTKIYVTLPEENVLVDENDDFLTNELEEFLEYSDG